MTVEDKASNSNPLLNKYMRDIGKYPVLSEVEQLDLFRRYRETSLEIYGQRLISHNLRLVVKIALEYRAMHSNLMDLIQEGNIGIVMSLRKFDPTKGVPFVSYAQFWIRAYILRFMLNNFGMMKVATSDAQRKIFYNLQKEKAKLEAQGIDASDAAVASALGVEESEVSEMDKRLANREAHLVSSDEESGALLENVMSYDPNPEECFEEAETNSLVRGQLESFSTRLQANQRMIFDARYLKEDPETFEVLAQRIGVTRQRIQQIDADLKKNLRRYMQCA